MSKARRKSRRPAPPIPAMPRTVAAPNPLEPSAPAPPVDRDPAASIIVGAPGRREARQQAKRRKRRRLGVTGTAVVVVLALAVASGAAFFATHANKKGPAEPKRTQRTLLVQVVDGGQTVVESVLLAYDAPRKTGALILIPSRVIAEVPGRGSAAFGQALGLGGPTASRDALADLMGITVDGTWVLSRTAFAGLIDRVGGVTVDVDTDVLAAAAGGTQVVIVRTGRQLLAGTAAVAFATYRASGETDLARLPRLQEVLDGLAQAAKAKGAAAVTAAIKALPATAKPTWRAEDLAGLLVGFPAAEVTEDTLPVHDIDSGGATAYGIDPTGLATLVSTALSDSVPASARAGNNRVLVQNGVGTPGVGESVRRKLDKAGFRYRAGGNVPGFTFRNQPSVVLIKDATAESIDAGQRVARALGLPVSDVKTDPQGQSVADIIVIIGADYHP